MKFSRHILPGLLLFVFVTACQNKHIYEQTIYLPESGWGFSKPVRFDFKIKDTTSFYNIFLNLRHQGTYDYSNIWLKVAQYGPGQQSDSRRLEYTLATPDGDWIGKGLSDWVDNPLILEEHIRFPQPGKYTFLINHDMRVDKLEEVYSLTLSVVRATD